MIDRIYRCAMLAAMVAELALLAYLCYLDRVQVAWLIYLGTHR